MHRRERYRLLTTTALITVVSQSGCNKKCIATPTIPACVAKCKENHKYKWCKENTTANIANVELASISGKSHWLNPNSPVSTLPDIFGPIQPDKAQLVRKSCESIPLEDFNSPLNAVTLVHNNATEKNPSTLESIWYTIPANAGQGTFALSSRTDQIGVKGGGTFTPEVKIEAGVEIEASSVYFVAARTAHKIQLQTPAEACVRSSICLSSGSGKYIRSATYGWIITLSLKDFSLHTSTTATAAQTASLEFNASTENISGFGAWLGDFRISEKCESSGETYDIPEVLEDIKNRRLITANVCIEEGVGKYGIVAVEIVEVTEEICNQENSPTPTTP